MHFSHMAIVVENLEESIKFYETMTELTIARRFKEGEAELAFLSNGAGATEIELVSMPGMERLESNGKGFFVCFLTDKLEAMHKLAQEEGYKPSPIRNPDPKSRYFYVYDPSGISVQLKQKF